MAMRHKFNQAKGLVAGLIVSIFGKLTGKATTDDLRGMEFRTSTQRLGVRFTDGLRDVFRLRWLRKS